MARGDTKSKWFFTDPKSRERDFVAEYRIRARCVSGRSIPGLGGFALLADEDDEGYQQLTLSGLTELLGLIEHWDCPVTIAPPDGDLPWTLELEDGPHAPDAPVTRRTKDHVVEDDEA